MKTEQLNVDDRIATWRAEKKSKKAAATNGKSSWSDPATPANDATAKRIQVDTALSRIVTAQSILNTEYPEPKWAVKGIIPEGTTVIAGPPKLGKSVFCLNLAVAVAEGGKALSHFDVERGSVLYLALEDGERRIKERLSRMTDGKLSDKIEVVTRWPRLDEGGLEAIEEWIKRHTDARLLLVDTFKRIRPLKANHHKAATTYDVDYDDVVPLTDLTTRNCIALGLVAHTRKLEAEDALAMVSGTYGLTGAADGALILARKRNSRTATLSVIGRDVEEQELALEFTPDTFMWSVLGKADDVKRSGERGEVVDLLAETDELMTPANIAQLLDKAPGAVRALLFKMKGAGEIKLFGNRYQLPDYQPSEPTKIRKPAKTKNVTALPVTKTTGNAGTSNADNGLGEKRYRVTDIAQNAETAKKSDSGNTGNAVTNSPQMLQSKDIRALPVENNAGNAGNGVHSAEGRQLLYLGWQPEEIARMTPDTVRDILSADDQAILGAIDR